MERRTFPLWLIRDVTALVSLALNFWSLMILVIANGRKAARGKKVSPRFQDFVMALLPIAEAHLHFALSRQAYRALGWNPGDVRLEHLPPNQHLARRRPAFRGRSPRDDGPARGLNPLHRNPPPDLTHPRPRRCEHGP